MPNGLHEAIGFVPFAVAATAARMPPAALSHGSVAPLCGERRR